MSREGELPIAETVRILRDVVSALAYAHTRGVVHRDVKPDNVLLSGGVAVVTDFGVAKAVSASSGGESSNRMTSLGVALGTPTYMAPEQATASPADRSSRRHLRARRHDLRDADGDAAVHRSLAPGGAGGARGRGAAPGRAPATRGAADARDAGPQCLAKRPADRPQSASDADARARRAWPRRAGEPRRRPSCRRCTAVGADRFPANGVGQARRRPWLLAALARGWSRSSGCWSVARTRCRAWCASGGRFGPGGSGGLVGRGVRHSARHRRRRRRRGLADTSPARGTAVPPLEAAPGHTGSARSADYPAAHRIPRRRRAPGTCRAAMESTAPVPAAPARPDTPAQAPAPPPAPPAPAVTIPRRSRLPSPRLRLRRPTRAPRSAPSSATTRTRSRPRT